MGYFVELIESNVVIKEENYGKAIDCFVQLMKDVGKKGSGSPLSGKGSEGDRWYAWVNTPYVLDVLKLEDKGEALSKAFLGWGYFFDRTIQGNGIELCHRERDKWGDDEYLWEALSSVLDEKSYLRFRGEEVGSYWQYKFENGTMCESGGKLVWE